jgi:hypothetical protein
MEQDSTLLMQIVDANCAFERHVHRKLASKATFLSTVSAAQITTQITKHEHAARLV